MYYKSILSPFSYYSYKGDAKLTGEVCIDVLKRTNNFNDGKLRNDFIQKYAPYIIRSQQKQNGFLNQYKLGNNIIVQYEHDINEHFIERFSVTFRPTYMLGDDSTRFIKDLSEGLPRNLNYECIDTTNNVYITKREPHIIPNIHLEKEFNPANRDDILKASLGITKRETVMDVMENGIGQLKVAFQESRRDRTFILSLVLSNVFLEVGEGRNKICEHFIQTYKSSGNEIFATHRDKVLDIKFMDNELANTLTEIHKILNYRPKINTDFPQSPVYSTAEFQIAKNLKQTLMDKMLSDLKTLDSKLIINMIELGITTVNYSSRNQHLCTISLI